MGSTSSGRAGALLLGAVLLSFAAGCGAEEPIEDEQLKIGFLYGGQVSDFGWSYAQDQTRVAIEASYPDVQTKIADGVPYDQFENVIDDMVDEGYTMFFGPGCCIPDQFMRSFEKHPDIIIENVNDRSIHDRMGGFYGRMYEANYLAGIVSARMTTTKKLGYLAAWREPSVLRPLNAFVLGARSVDPEVEVHVGFINEWHDPETEASLTDDLMAAGCDVIHGHTNSAARLERATAEGMYSIGFHSDMLSVAPSTVLTSAMWNWKPYAVDRVRAVIDGTWAAQDTWGGLNQDMVQLGSWGDMVPQEVREEAEAKREEIANGDFDVFSGEIRMQDGSVWLSEGESFSDDDLHAMDAFVEGVVGDIEEGMPFSS